MLSEKQLDDLLAIFLKRTQSVVEEYLIRMGEQIQDIGKLIPSSINRLVQLKRMNANLDAINREIARLAEISMEDLEKIFAAAAESDARFVAEKFGNEYKTPILENYALQQILKAQLRVTLNEMANISRTRISSIAYQNAVDKAIQAAQMGVEDYNKAVRRALSEAAEAGIRMEIGHTGAYEKRIGYGGRYTRRLDSAVRQNVLDGIRSLNNEVLAQAGEEFGADGVELSAHMLCAEDHLPYQGRQFSNARFLEIQEEELDRPFGMWNCRHSIYPIILGVSRPTYTEEELAAFERNSKERIEIDGVTKTRYQWTQEQRRIETAVRRQKDVAVAFKASGDMQGRREVQANINVLMEKYKGISEKINVKQQYDRMRVDGFSAVKAVAEIKNKKGIDVRIDELTPCLRNNASGELVKTTVSKVSPTRKTYSHWEFDWTQPEKDGFTVYALRVKGQRTVQGLMASKVEQGYVDVALVEAAPQNNPHNSLYFPGQKEYNGVGGHLFAEACRQSYEHGFGGYIAFTAKTNLIEHYKKELGAKQLSKHRMVIEEREALALIKKYYGG